MGLKFDIANKNVYPPKPASLLLAKTAIKNVKPQEKVLDMCTGCGVVAIAMAKFVPNLEVFASDINPEAISIAKKNVKLNKVKVNLVQSNLYKRFRDNEFDMITVHPPAVPYLKSKDWSMTEGMKIATNGGPDGSKLVIRSIIEAKRCLKKKGRLLLLLPHWSNTKKAYRALRRNYTRVSELTKLEVQFFPAIEYNPDTAVLNHIYRLAKDNIIEIKIKNKNPYSIISVIKATKK